MASLPGTGPWLFASRRSRRSLLGGIALAVLLPLGCLTPPPRSGAVASPGTGASTRAEPMDELDAWTAASRMSPGINIGNTLENTTQWETGWGNPPITRGFVERLAELGFKTVGCSTRIPDTNPNEIDQLARAG